MKRSSSICLLLAVAGLGMTEPPSISPPDIRPANITSTTMGNGAADASPEPDWVHDVQPIIARRCGRCHHADGAGPFPLGSHREVASRGGFIVDLVDSGRMPPWLPENAGWRDDRRLTEDEKTTLRRWVESGANLQREGVGAPSANPTAASPNDVGSTVATNEMVRSLGAAFEVPAESDPAWHQGNIDQRGTTMSLENREPLRIRGVRIETGAPQAVRLASFAFDDTGAGRYLDQRDPRVGFLMSADAGLIPSGAHGIVLGGLDQLRWPEGYHLPVPANADAVIEWHYRPTGMIESVSPTIRLELLGEDEDSLALRWLPVGVGRVQIPAETIQTVETEPLVMPADAMLVGLTPRALEITRTIELFEIPPGRTRESGTSILRIGDWDHHQRETLVLETPRMVPKGTRFVARFTLDNRSENPANPDVPAVDIRRGRRTGVLATLLHVAAISPQDDPVLERLGPEAVKGLRGLGTVRVDQADSVLRVP